MGSKCYKFFGTVGISIIIIVNVTTSVFRVVDIYKSVVKQVMVTISEVFYIGTIVTDFISFIFMLLALVTIISASR